MNIAWPQGWSCSNKGITFRRHTYSCSTCTYTHQAKSDDLAVMLDVKMQSAAKLIDLLATRSFFFLSQLPSEGLLSVYVITGYC